MGSCPNEQQIKDLAAGTLTDGLTKRLRKHIESCAECRAVFKEWEVNSAYAEEVRDVARGGTREQLATLTESSVSASDSQVIEAMAADGIPGYRIVREIHRGGQGVIYQAIQEGTLRKVAIKVMLEGRYASTAARHRFEREVRLIAELNHPNIVAIHDSGVAHGKHYFVMDYVRGSSLDGYVRSNHLPVRQIVALFHQIADATGFAHRRGVTHRDLKPANILVSQDGRPTIVDFGLAWTADRSASQDFLGDMRSGRIFGTLHYMSPEQTSGDPDSIDTRSDVYALGVVLYELLTGNPAYDTRADVALAIRNIRQSTPTRPSKVTKAARRTGVDQDLDAIVLKALSKRTEERYQSANEFAQDLKAWLDGRPISAKTASSLYLLRKLIGRHKTEASILAFGTLPVIAFALISHQINQSTMDRLRDESDERQMQHVQYVTAYQQVARQAEEAQQLKVFGWFLLEWENGRLQRARAIRHEMPRKGLGGAFIAAMDFLTEDDYTERQLRRRLEGDETEVLLHFVLGERAYREAQLEEARQEFLACSRAGGMEWLKAAAITRLNELNRRLEAEP